MATQCCFINAQIHILIICCSWMYLATVTTVKLIMLRWLVTHSSYSGYKVGDLHLMNFYELGYNWNSSTTSDSKEYACKLGYKLTTYKLFLSIIARPRIIKYGTCSNYCYRQIEWTSRLQDQQELSRLPTVTETKDKINCKALGVQKYGPWCPRMSA